MYVYYVYVSVYIYIYTYKNICIYIHMYMHVYIHVYKYFFAKAVAFKDTNSSVWKYMYNNILRVAPTCTHSLTLICKSHHRRRCESTEHLKNSPLKQKKGGIEKQNGTYPEFEELHEARARVDGNVDPVCV